ncbi:MAG: hypothetical protein AAGA77_17980 [Bacteroidota bacterium]
MKFLQVFLKKSIPYIVSVLVLIALNIVVFYPQLQGKRLSSTDITTYIAKTNESKKHYKETGERSYWNASMFSGMPEGLLSLGRSKNVLSRFKGLLKLYIERPLGMFLQLGLLCFIALCLMGVNTWLALLGAITLNLNTGFFLLLDAGHMTKINVISVLPLIVVGTLLSFRGDFLKGAAAIAIGTSYAIIFNHIQMLYYLIFALFVIGVVYLIFSLKEKTLPNFSKGALVALAAAAIAGFSNFSQLYSSKSFSEDTMRGAPILEKKAEQKAQSSSEVVGLEWEYAMQWSYDSKDLMAMLVPRFVGGGSGERVAASSDEGKLMKRIGGQRDRGKFIGTPGYWGDLPFTGGPNYFGIPLILLFVLSLFVLEPKIKWAFLGAVLIFVLISMGKNAAWLNKALFDYVPLFSKFRAPNSILMAMPILVIIPSILGLQKIINTEDKKKYLKPLFYSTGIVGGICLAIILLGGSMFDFLRPNELQYDSQVQDILRRIRVGMQKSDAIRSLLFTVLVAGVLWSHISGKIKGYLFVLLGVVTLVVVDNMTVNSRYLKSYDFMKKSEYNEQFRPSQNDEMIFRNEPKGLGFYRVFDLSVNTFNNALPSYHHHQIGGYDAAKLQRYQDVVEQYIGTGNMQVLNMLNTKYFITQEGQVSPNPRANGTVWFVKNIVPVNSSREELDAVGTIGTDSSAVVFMKEFADQNIKAGNGQGSIELVDYQLDKLVYKSTSRSDQVAIFSEVWYGPNKGWEVTIDGQKADHFRANYILRGMQIPKGDHEIVFEFKPTVEGGWLTLISSILILGFALGLIGVNIRKEITA